MTPEPAGTSSGKQPRRNKTTITRRRTGCIPCRDRHVRCDEGKPKCRRCDRSCIECNWSRDIRIVFHQPTNPTRKQDALLKENIRSVSDGPPSAIEPPSCQPEPGVASVFAVDLDPQQVQERFTSWARVEASQLVQNALRTELEVTLMHNYLTECAPWFDAHTGQQYYSRLEVQGALNCPPWRAAAMALSAKNIELRERRSLMQGSHSLPLHLYQLAVRLTIDAMSGRFESVGTLAGCVLLCVYEMMTVTYTDWHRHLRGCASIYTHNHWNGSTGGLISCSFWAYARIDIWAAFCAATRTILPPETWFDNPDAIMRMRNVDEDLHSQIAIWLTARVVNIVCDESDPAQNPASSAIWLAMDCWEDMGGQTTRPVIFRNFQAGSDRPFPRILFSTHSSTIGHTMFHSSMILLLEFEASKEPGDSSRLKEEAYNHALLACGIIETNNHTACLVNSLQPLYICGRHMRTRSEKFAVLELLGQIERKTGWRCGWRSNQLREIWDLC